MTSQAQALDPLPGVRGDHRVKQIKLGERVFFAFPLHLAGKPAVTRAEHLAEVAVPMLFLSGSKDASLALEIALRSNSSRTPRPCLPRSGADRP